MKTQKPSPGSLSVPRGTLASPSASHTPGPWHPITEGTAKAPDWIAVFNASGKWALATLSLPAGVERAEVEANAHLIAAAPDLLAALREFVTDAEAEAGGYMAKELRAYTRERLAAMGREAIAKAEGRP